MKNNKFGFLVMLVWFFAMRLTAQHTITSGNLLIEVNDKMQTRVHSTLTDSPFETGFQNSEYLTVRKKDITSFPLKSAHKKVISDQIGAGKAFFFAGIYDDGKYKIEKQLQIRVYDKFPDLAIYKVQYINHSVKTLKIKKWTNNRYRIRINPRDTLFWSFQGSSTSARADWILPVKADFFQQNYMGMNNSDYGGGIPVVDIWRSDAGIAIGHVTMYPQLMSLPVEREEGADWATIAAEKNYKEPLELEPGDTLSTLETFVMSHTGDCFNSLRRYTDFMKAKGMQFAESEPAAYEPIWCAWGYERDFTLDEIIGTLGKAKEIGFKWAVLDDGYQQGEGDWEVNSRKFPGGDAQMKALVDSIHAYGMKAKLWWAPLAVDPCTNLLHENPDIILYTEEWAPRIITWWDAYYMGPTYAKTKEHTKETLKMFLDKWGFDGLKMDGQHMNAVPPDHNPKHNLEYPEQACEQLPAFFKSVYEEVRDKKPHAVIENCPCGCCMSFYNMPYINQAVSSDPLSSWQIRLKGKVYKAIIPRTAYYGDHVELSTGGEDFASSFGVGAVLGSKFTWPKDNPKAEGVYLLTPEKERKWKKWIGLYNKMMLSKGNYLGGLYDVGFDYPETHVIEKDGKFYYAFYADSFDGEIELRGLSSSKKYRVRDYFNDKSYGVVRGSHPVLKVSFKGFLLLEVM